MELCLGTVQFGMDYGIYNQKQPKPEDAISCLDYATQNGILTIDTANAYGTAEDVIGAFLRKKTISRNVLHIISKLKPNLLDDADEDNYYHLIKKNLEDSLSRLGTDYLNTYLLHSSRYIFNDAIIDTLNRLKKEGYAEKVGVSVYEPEEAKKCIERKNVDIMQLPYSIFDQRMKNAGVFEMAIQEGNTQIHSRSAFIQGLILMREDEVPPFLYKAKPILRKINEACLRYGVSRISLAMNYVKKESAISHLVFGIDNIKQLEEDINLFQTGIPDEIVDAVSKDFTDIEADIVMPSLWRR